MSRNELNNAVAGDSRPPGLDGGVNERGRQLTRDSTLHDVPASQSRDRILDAWRGVSVLLVVLGHSVGFRFAGYFGGSSNGRVGDLPINPAGVASPLGRVLYFAAIHAGDVGVQCFFVISGYIITTLLIREHQRHGRISISAFYTRRAFRILPPLLIVIAFTLAMTALGYITVGERPFLLATTFLCNTSLGDCGWFLAHLWSLGIEEQFYLAWPLILVALGFRGVSRMALTLMVLFALLGQFSVLTVGSIHNGLGFACIAAGALYATSERLRAGVARAATVASVVAAFVLVLFWGQVPIVWRLQILLTPLVTCFVIFACFKFRGVLEKLPVVRGLAGLGVLSYGLYLWQEIFLAAPKEYLQPSILEYAPLAVVMTVLSYRILERPLMRVGAGLSRRLIARGAR